jgi:hypothetical protein
MQLLSLFGPTSTGADPNGLPSPMGATCAWNGNVRLERGRSQYRRTV